jgi:hypothetical protein
MAQHDDDDSFENGVLRDGARHRVPIQMRCSTLSISAAYGGAAKPARLAPFFSKGFRVLAAASKQGRCPAANAVGSSRKNNSVYERPQTSRRGALKLSTQQIHCLDAQRRRISVLVSV